MSPRTFGSLSLTLSRYLARCAAFSLLVSLSPAVGQALEFGMPSIFSDHMVLQAGVENKVWGWAPADAEVQVEFDGATQSTKAGQDGRWSVKLAPAKAGLGHKLSAQSGGATLSFSDVAVGEVWLCSGQSNMEWGVNISKDADLEKLMAKKPTIRFITVPKVGVQTPQRTFEGGWKECSPDSIGECTAVGYFFGRVLNDTLDTPIGLIDNAWGGSAAEAWIRRDLLENDANYKQLMTRWANQEGVEEHKNAMTKYEADSEAWSDAWDAARREGKPLPEHPHSPDAGQLAGNHRPGNLYNGCLHPVMGYGIRGAIWYQGESNAEHAYQYRELFPLMIQTWRNDWSIGNFPFYWVQLADFKQEQPEPSESDWAELREAQTMTMNRVPHSGQAVIIDIGEGDDIHPKNKQDVARRLARWALANEYKIPIAFRSPQYQSMEVQEGKVLLHFNDVGRGLETIDTPQPVGFAVAGDDKKFVWAEAKIVGDKRDTIEVSAAGVAKPVAVRYAWGDNPKNNVHSSEGLPLTPFRTDDWPGVTMGK